MYTLLIRFKKQLFIITLLGVISFQFYWLYKSFELKKREFIDQTQIETKQILINNFLNQLYTNPRVNFSEYKKELTRKKNDQELIMIVETDRFGKNKALLGKKKNVDSILYSSLKKNLPDLFKYGDISIYKKHKDSIQVYPKNHPYILKDTTKFTNSLADSKAKIQVHIKNLNTTTLHAISGTIIFSFFYILLFLGTLIIIYRNLNLNQTLLKNKEVFTRNMTHELKIPLSTITIAIEALNKYKTNEVTKNSEKYLNGIKKATQQLSLLIDSILENARVDNLKKDLPLEPINLTNLLRDVQENMALIIEQSETKISIESINNNLKVKGNYMLLKQVFLNLVDNSIKYSDEKPFIIISVQQKDKRLLINIDDNGIGISQKHLKNIFTPFYRIMEDDLHNVKGFGLGLSFVRKSLQAQGGSIRIMNKDTKGTKIEINLAIYE